MNTVLEVGLLGIAISVIAELFKKYIPKENEILIIRIITFIISFSSVATFWQVEKSLSFQSVEEIRSFLSDVVTVYGATIISYYGLIKNKSISNPTILRFKK